MARGIVCHLAVNWRRSYSHFDRRELLAHITHSGTEVRGLVCKFFVVSKKMHIRREHRATAARICDDRRIGIESRDVLSRKFACAFEISCVCMKRAATHLFSGRADVEVISTQHALRCPIASRKEPFANTPSKHQYGFLIFAPFVAPLRLCVKNSF